MSSRQSEDSGSAGKRGCPQRRLVTKRAQQVEKRTAGIPVIEQFLARCTQINGQSFPDDCENRRRVRPRPSKHAVGDTNRIEQHLEVPKRSVPAVISVSHDGAFDDYDRSPISL